MSVPTIMIKKENTPRIETEQLILRKFNQGDTDALLNILIDV